MRKLPYLLVLLLLSLMLLAAAASAHASILPVGGAPTALTATADEEEAEADDEEAEESEGDEESEDCEAEEEGDEEPCEEELEAEEDEECVVEDAHASVVVAPGNRKVLLTVHYRAFEPAMVSVDTSLRGAKGGLHLGDERARFQRSGTFHDSFSLGSRQIGKARAAREFEVNLHAVGTPADCAIQLATRGSRRAK
ncbi:MAG: hypothetical protein ACTHN3_07715 [Solirubrobacterales bacterium]